MPFKSALLEPAVENGCPVHYATIHYEAAEGAPPASQWVCWWDDTPFGAHVLRMLREPGYTATVTFGAEPIVAADRKTLVQDLWQAASKQFTPID